MLKIFQFEGGGHFLCLNDDRNWGLLIGDDFSSFEKNGAILGLLPVLDIDYEVFAEKINALGLSPSLAPGSTWCLQSVGFHPTFVVKAGGTRRIVDTR
ncbi:MAG: hypothetical protein WCR52_21035 [Bacteroidota bacterium]